MLDRPFAEVLQSGQPNFPFCLGWANHSWTGTWYGAPDRLLIEQSYPGEDDHERHFDTLLTAFSDPRYMTFESRPILLIFRPLEIPMVRKTMDLWRRLAERAGLPGLHLVGIPDDASWDPISDGFDAACAAGLSRTFSPKLLTITGRLRRKIHSSKLLAAAARRVSPRPFNVYDYSRASDLMISEGVPNDLYYPCVIPNWDNTPRSGVRGSVLTDSTPQAFRRHLRAALKTVAGRPPEQRIVIVKSWNEWAEGNYLEPDQRYNRAFLEVVRDEVLV